MRRARPSVDGRLPTCCAPAAALLLLLLTALGCTAFHATNRPLARWDAGYGYRLANVIAQRPGGRVLLLLAFSGGGTRAAALAYGVLQELRDTEIATGGERRRLLDEVDAITSVSGGSFTAAYYGLYRERTFDDFETRFLRRNVQWRLILRMFNPYNWIRLASPFYQRSDIAIEYYDENVFDGATFADVLAAHGPMVQINATDLAASHHFTFFQPQFDLLCSDLSTFKVARAVAASSAVPVLFSPIVLRNYAGSCGFERPAWLEASLAERKTDPRRFRTAMVAEGYLNASDRPYIHLLDGGIADNLGLRVPLENVLLAGGLSARLEHLQTSVDEIAVIVVNAEARRPPRFALAAQAPSLAAVLGAVTDTQIFDRNLDTLDLTRESLVRWAARLPPASDGRPVRTHLVEVAFEAIEDPAARAYFNKVPTSFTLSDETVDRLIAVSRQLLRESPEYQALVADLQAQTPP